MAIEQGLTILGWYENLGKDEMPPEYLWEDAEGLEQWWAHVEAKREDGVSTSRGPTDQAHEDQPREMTENDYARYVKSL